MALSSIAIATLQDIKRCLGLTSRDARLIVPGIDIYHDGTSGASATVQVTDVALILTDDGGTTTLTLADVGNDTIAELVDVINDPSTGDGNWVAQALTYGDATSGDLVETAATSVFGSANRGTLKIVDNRRLEKLIEAVTDGVEKWLDRGIASRTYSELYHYSKHDALREFALQQPEVTSVDRVLLDTLDVLEVAYSGADARATVEVTDAAIVLRDTTTGTTTLTFATSTTLSTMATAISAVTGWSGSVRSGVTSSDATSFLVRDGVRSAKSRTVVLASWQDYESDYVVDYDAGVVTIDALRWPFSMRSWPAPSVVRFRIDYTAGFASVPDDIAQVACEMVTQLYYEQGRDQTVQSESLGDYSYSLSVGTDTGSREADWKGRLEQYRRMLP